jgi:hypothetical protein
MKLEVAENSVSGKFKSRPCGKFQMKIRAENPDRFAKARAIDDRATGTPIGGLPSIPVSVAAKITPFPPHIPERWQEQQLPLVPPLFVELGAH